MEQIDRELAKLQIARGDGRALAFVHLSASSCMVSLVIPAQGDDDAFNGTLVTIGRGATAKEALDSARRHSEATIQAHNEAFRRERTATVRANTARVSSKVAALQDAADERIERKASRKRRDA